MLGERDPAIQLSSALAVFMMRNLVSTFAPGTKQVRQNLKCLQHIVRTVPNLKFVNAASWSWPPFLRASEYLAWATAWSQRSSRGCHFTVRVATQNVALPSSRLPTSTEVSVDLDEL